MKIESNSAEETFALGKQCGEKAAAGQVYCLYGDLGVGKTVFTKGFAAGLGIKEPVSRPTFTILQVYDEGRLPFYHFDVYRISDPEEMYEIGFEEYIEGEGVCFIEWANLIEELLPAQYTEIHIDKDLSKGFCCFKENMIIEFVYTDGTPDEWKSLMSGVRRGKRRRNIKPLPIAIAKD